MVWVVMGVSLARTRHLASTAAAPAPPAQLACWVWLMSLPPTQPVVVPPLHDGLTRFEPAGITTPDAHCAALWHTASVPRAKGPAPPLLGGAPAEDTPTQNTLSCPGNNAVMRVPHAAWVSQTNPESPRSVVAVAPAVPPVQEYELYPGNVVRARDTHDARLSVAVGSAADCVTPAPVEPPPQAP